MNFTPEIIEAIFTGIILGLGMAVYRVYQHQTKDNDLVEKKQEESSGNGFRVAMESVKEAYGINVELLHRQIDQVEAHVIKLEEQNMTKDEVIDRLQELLRANGIIVNDEGQIVSYRSEKSMEQRG